MRLKGLFFKSTAFSLTELLVTLAIVGTMSVVGVKAYRNQLNRAKTAEAQQILAFIYSNERQFYNAWNTYHENLISVGAVPSGNYRYDVGFTATGSKTDGDLGSYPLKEVLDLAECINFNRICTNNECVTKMKSKAKTALGSNDYFENPAICTVNSGLLVQNTGKTDGTADADMFKAYATSKLGGNDDIWSINQKQEVKHEADGTN